MPKRFRPICTGVRISPQGKPHQPKNKLNSAPVAWLFIPHARHEICGALLQEVSTSADHTLWLT